MPSAEAIAPRIGILAKAEVPRIGSKADEGIESLLSMWAAIFQQQITPIVPEAAPPPTGDLELSLTKNANDTEKASDTTNAAGVATASAGPPPAPAATLQPEAPHVTAQAAPPFAAALAIPLTPANLQNFQTPVAPAENSKVPIQEANLVESEESTLRTTVSLKRNVAQRLGIRFAPIDFRIPKAALEPDGNSVLSGKIAMPVVEPSDDASVEAEPLRELNSKDPSEQSLLVKEIVSEPTRSTVEFGETPRTAAATTVVSPVPQLANEVSVSGKPSPSPSTIAAPLRLAPPPPLIQEPPRETTTISIRIPFTEAGVSNGTRHIDLVFQNKNNDLTLQFHSPSTDIQQRIEDALPALLDKLQTADWAAKPAEPLVAGPSADLLLDMKKRAEPLAAAVLNAEPKSTVNSGESTAQTGSRSDDPAPNRRESSPQSQTGRNRKKDQAWQFEIDAETEA